MSKQSDEQEAEQNARIYANAMSRGEVLVPGKYVSIPKAWLADPTLSAGAKLVLIVYVEALGPKNRDAYPGHETIAKQTGLSVRGVQNCIEQLIKKGWLTSPGFSSAATRKYCVNRTHTPTGNADSAFPAEVEGTQKVRSLTQPKGTQKVRSPARRNCVPCPEKSADEVPKGITTEGKYRREEAGKPASAAAGRPLAATTSPILYDFAITNGAGGTALNGYTTASTNYVEDDDEEYPAFTQDRPNTNGDSEGSHTGNTGDTACIEQGASPAAAAQAVQQAATAQTSAQQRGRRKSANADATRAAMRPATKAIKGSGMTDDQKRLACSSIDGMLRYICFGPDALVPGTDCNKLPPTRANFYERRKPDGSADIENWTSGEFSGFFWFRACEYRVARGQPLELPNWGRLAKAIDALLATRTRMQVFDLISIATKGFDVIRFMLGKLGHGLLLNEGALQHRLVIEKADQIKAMDSEGRRQLDWEASEVYPQPQVEQRQAA